jgi:protocatechuate 3,4-dioxygenase beta subunit
VAIPEDAGDFQYDILLPSGSIEGMVTGPPESKGVAGVVVQARETGAQVDLKEWHVPFGRVVTDKEGVFSITGLAAGEYRLTATREGYGPAYATLMLGENEQKTGVLLELTDKATLRVHVTDAQDGAPIKASIVIADENGAPMVSATDVRPAGGDGFYEVDLRPGFYRVYISSIRGYVGAVRDVEVTGQEPALLEIALVPGTVLHISTYDENGRPVNNPRATVYDADGPVEEAFKMGWMNMVMCVVHPGPGRVEVSAEGFGSVSQEFNAPAVDKSATLTQPHSVNITLPGSP